MYVAKNIPSMVYQSRTYKIVLFKMITYKKHKVDSVNYKSYRTSLIKVSSNKQTSATCVLSLVTRKK